MRTTDMIKSNYISKAEVKAAGAIVLTIADLSLEKFGSDEKWVLWFNDHPKGLTLNNTKIKLLEAAYGEESTAWNGRRVRLTFDPSVMMSGQVIGGIRLECSTAQHTARGAAPAQRPPGAPPPPVWDGKKWVFTEPAAPPPPVWDGTKWVVTEAAAAAPAEFDRATGEIYPAQPAHPSRPQTISERVNQGHPPAVGRSAGTGAPESGEDPEFGHQPIPF